MSNLRSLSTTPWVPDHDRPLGYMSADPNARAEIAIVSFAGDPAIDWRPTLRSILNQTVQSWVWLHIGNDSPALVRELSMTDTRVRLAGAAPEPGASIMALIEQTGCAYGCLIEPGVAVAPTFLEKCILWLDAHPKASFCNTLSAGSIPGQIWNDGFERGAEFLSANFAGMTCVFRQAALPLVLGPTGEIDQVMVVWDRWLRLAADGRWGGTVDEALIRYPAGSRWPPFQPADHTAADYRMLAARRYPQLHGHFPRLPPSEPVAYADVPIHAPLTNQLAHSEGRHLLLIMPWLIVGGAERVNLDLIRHLCRSEGYTVTIATTIYAEHAWAAEFAAITSDIFLLDRLVPVSDYPRVLTYLITSRQIDVVLLSNSAIGYLLLPYLRAWCPQTAFVDLLHSFEESWKNGGYPRSGVGYQELLDLNITSSQYVKRWMVGRGANQDQIEICYTNIDVEKWQRDAAARARLRNELQLSDDQTLIVFHGRISTEKRPQLLAQILARLSRECGDRFRCLVIGDGPERESLALSIEALQLGAWVRLTGRLNDADLLASLSAADILLLPSQVEGISVATLESMAMGIVPVSARVGGQAEVISEECGFLIDHGDDEIEQYVRVLTLLLRDTELRQRMGAAARARVEEHFPLRAFGPRMAKLLQIALDRATHAPRPSIGRGLGREHAVLAFESLRLEQIADYLWLERERLRAQPAQPPTFAPARSQAVNTIWARFAPVYRWAVAHGLPWLAPLKNKLIGWMSQRRI